MDIIKKYWQLSLFRETPAETPYSLLLTYIIAIVFFAIVVSQWMISDLEHKLDFGSAVLIAISLMLSYTVFTVALLKMFKKSERILQTIASIFATHSIIHLFAFPLLLILTPILLKVEMAKVLGPIIGIIYLVLTLILTVWQFSISTYIYKEALEIDYFPAVLASLGLLACNILMVSIWR